VPIYASIRIYIYVGSSCARLDYDLEIIHCKRKSSVALELTAFSERLYFDPHLKLQQRANFTKFSTFVITSQVEGGRLTSSSLHASFFSLLSSLQALSSSRRANEASKPKANFPRALRQNSCSCSSFRFPFSRLIGGRGEIAGTRVHMARTYAHVHYSNLNISGHIFQIRPSANS
jgi:hypothetical protein